MNNLLYELYNGSYSFEPEPDEEWENISNQLLGLSEQIKDTMGLAFLDRWSNAQAEADDWRSCRSYQAGFRLGAQLMLAALMPA